MVSEAEGGPVHLVRLDENPMGIFVARVGRRMGMREGERPAEDLEGGSDET